MASNNVARYNTPMSPHRRPGEPDPLGPLSPESVSSPPPPPKLYRFEWAPDPYDSTKLLGPPEVAIRNRLFAVEFRILSAEEFRPEVNFYARVHPGLSEAFHLARERVTTNTWERAVLFITHEGVYGIDVTIRPDLPGYLIGHVRHRYMTTVFDGSDGVHVPPGAFEQRILSGGEQSQVENMETPSESNGQSTIEDIQSQENTDDSKMDDLFTEWLRFSPEP